MTIPKRRPAEPPRRTLDSPWLAALLAVAVLALAAVLILPGLLGAPGPGATATPAGSTTPLPTVTPSPAEPTFVRPTPSPAATFVSYVVRQGDTLNSIAKQFATTARSIAWWNRGTYPSLDPESEAYNPDRLDVGWTLVLIPGTVVDDTNPPTPSPGPPTPSPLPSATASAVVTPALERSPRSRSRSTWVAASTPRSTSSSGSSITRSTAPSSRRASPAR